jgi:hypothetical protein
VGIETACGPFRRSEGLSIETGLTIFEPNPALEAFENEVGTAFNKGQLMKISPRPVKNSIKRIDAGAARILRP